MIMKAIGYVRRSTDRQEESLDQQRTKLRAFAAAKGWELVEVYEDDAISGSDMKRPGLLRLLDRAEKDGEITAVVAWDRNRLARPKDAVDGMMLERRLTNAGKRVLYAATGQEVDRSFLSGLVGYIEHHQNGDYLRKLSRDTSRGLLAKVKRGLWPGGPIPFGFDRLILNDDGTPRRIVRMIEDGSLQVIDHASGQIMDTIAAGKRFRKQDHEQCTLIPSNPERVRALQKMFTDYAAGVPCRKIRDDLNTAGFKTSYARTFCIPSINVILENQAYLGKLIYNRRTESKWHRIIDGTSIDRHDEGWERRPESDWVVVENAWPSLIDPDTFKRVQDRRKQSQRGESIRTTGTAIHAGYVLSGLAFCGICGGKLSGSTTTSGKGFKTRYYTCERHHRGDKAACPKRYTVPADLVENHILDLIRTDLSRLQDDSDLHAKILEELTRLSGHTLDAQRQMQKRLAELDQQTTKIKRHLLTLDPETAQTLGIYDEAKRIAQEHQAVEKQLQAFTRDIPKLPSKAELNSRISLALDRFQATFNTGTLEEKRELISLYVKKIEADPDRCAIRISLYPSLLSSEIGVTGRQ